MHNFQVQLDFLNVWNSFKSSFLYQSSAIPNEGMMSDDVLEIGALDYINSYLFVGISVRTNFFKVRKISKDITISPHQIPEKKIRYDPKTGEEVQNN